jgi:hypothetical protein
MGLIKAQCLYRMRCECGRPWFATEVPKSNRCSTCAVLPAGANAKGTEVREEPTGLVDAQRLYQMRCECGRQWFELEVTQLAKCPACAKLSVVSL